MVIRYIVNTERDLRWLSQLILILGQSVGGGDF